MDRRQQKTRNAIFSAFSKLLEQKNFNNITVKEIIDEANIGRSTFYAHFETKDDLLKSMCTDIFEHVFSSNLKEEKGHDFSHAGHNLDKQITHILYHLKENGKNLKGILSCESGELFMRYFKQYLSTMFSPLIEQHIYHSPTTYILNNFVCSFAETVRWWITSNEQYSPEEVASFFLECSNIMKTTEI